MTAPPSTNQQEEAVSHHPKASVPEAKAPEDLEAAPLLQVKDPIVLEVYPVLRPQAGAILTPHCPLKSSICPKKRTKCPLKRRSR